MAEINLEIQILLAVSIALNLILGFLVVAKYIRNQTPKPPLKRPQDIEFAKYCVAILVGFWGGIIGNALVSSMFEIQKQNQNTPPWFYLGIFVICVFGSILFTILLYTQTKNVLEPSAI